MPRLIFNGLRWLLRGNIYHWPFFDTLCECTHYSTVCQKKKNDRSHLPSFLIFFLHSLSLFIFLHLYLRCVVVASALSVCLFVVTRFFSCMSMMFCCCFCSVRNSHVCHSGSIPLSLFSVHFLHGFTIWRIVDNSHSSTNLYRYGWSLYLLWYEWKSQRERETNIN